MSNIYYVEDSIAITPKELLDIANHTSTKKMRTDIDCWYSNENESDNMSVSINGKEPQGVSIEWIEITYGRMAYFQCNCGRRSLKLYKPSHKAEFRCRGCLNLRYRICSFNTSSIAGRQIHRMNRITKLVETRETISHIFFKGKFTSRYSSFLVQCQKVGLHEVVENSKMLQELINQEV